MEFLEKLYEIENFGIYLFVVIGILIVLFLIILFFGKKDAKKEAIKEQMEKTAFEDQEEAKPLEVEETVIPAPVEATFKVEEPVKLETPVVTTNQVLNDDFDSATEEVIQEKEFDFDALAAAISKELESIDQPKVEEEVIRPVIEEKEEIIFPTVEPIYEEPKIEVSQEVHEVKPVIEEEKTRPVMPSVFSSVYVNREKETPKQEEVKKEEVPVKPAMELPKKMDLPKRVQ